MVAELFVKGSTICPAIVFSTFFKFCCPQNRIA